MHRDQGLETTYKIHISYDILEAGYGGQLWVVYKNFRQCKGGRRVRYHRVRYHRVRYNFLQV